jgi:hypothetical protein
MTEFEDLSEDEQTNLRLGDYGSHRRYNPETALLNEVPFGMEDRTYDERKKDLKTRLVYGLDNVISDKKILPDTPTQFDRSRIIKAKKGFHGYITHPMEFIAGEAGRERINIHKVKDKHHDDFWNVSKYFEGRF